MFFGLKYLGFGYEHGRFGYKRVDLKFRNYRAEGRHTRLVELSTWLEAKIRSLSQTTLV